MTIILNGTAGITFPDGTTQVDGLSTPVPVADGGTGSATAADARTALGTNDAANITTGTLAVARGGTGAATLTANNVLLGNGTSALQAVAPGSNGNILTSNGTTWTSAAPAGGGVTSLNGNTGALNGWAKITSGTFSSASSISIGSLPSGYISFRLVIKFTTSGASFYPGIRISGNGGSSYQSSGYNTSAVASDGASPQVINRSNESSVFSGSNFYWSSNSVGFLDFYLYQYISTGGRITGSYTSATVVNDSQVAVGGMGVEDTFYVDGLQIVRTNGSGTLTGTYVIYGSK